MNPLKFARELVMGNAEAGAMLRSGAEQLILTHKQVRVVKKRLMHSKQEKQNLRNFKKVFQFIKII